LAGAVKTRPASPDFPLCREGEAWCRARDGDLKPDCFWRERSLTTIQK